MSRRKRRGMGSGDGERGCAGEDSRLAIKVGELKKSNTASEKVVITCLEVCISILSIERMRMLTKYMKEKRER